MGGKSISTSATRLEALSIQSSTYGATIPWVRGMQRLPGNLLWYGNFKSIARTQKTGGKGGGGGTSTTYTYTASLMMALCHGTVTDIPRVWKGKGTSTLSGLSLTRLSGAVGQGVWSGLTGMGAQVIGYSGLAMVAGQNYDLGDSASVENHSFEVQHASAYAISAGIPDVDPSVALADLLTDASEGAGLSPSVLASWTQWSNWCVASGLLVSPLLTEQTQAIDVLRTAADLTNTGVVWSDGKLKMVPYADQGATGNGATFTPNNTPVYQLDDTCYTPASGQEPLRVTMKTPADLFNHVRVEYRDRANSYQIAIAEAKDLTDISANGLRSMPTISAHWICTAAVARQVAEMRKQRALLVANTYEFELPWHYALIEPMDLITLSDTALGMVNVPARVTEVIESDDGTLTVRAEDFPAGSANAPLYPAQSPAGFAGNTYADPGATNKVVIFEGPGALTGKQLQVWVAARGDGAMWGGCTVWVSLDGTTYTALGKLQGGSRCGVLTGPIASGALPVQIGAAQQLVTVSAADAAALNSLCYIGGGNPEFVGYTSATLTGAGAYTLGGLVRSAYGTTGTAHSTGDDFAFVDQSVAKSDAIDPSYIGKTIYIKVTSFNVFGLSEQSLASVSALPYVITGAVMGSASTGISIGLTTDTLVLPADNTGAVTSYALASTVASVLVNGIDDTANWTFSGAPSSGLSFTRSGATFTITGLAAATDTATLTITASKAGNPSLTKTLYVTKAKSGANGSPGSPGSPGADGINGRRTADAIVYAWSAAGAPAISGTSTYTWASGTLSAAPSGWSLTPGTPTPGFTLYQAVVRLSNTSTSSTDTVNWTGAAISPISTAGANGGSAKVAYTVLSSGSTLGTGTRSSTGASSVPATNSWGLGEAWQANSPSYGTNQTVWQTNGIYDPASNTVTWDSPFISALKVGSLSAISANLGTITAGTITGVLIQTASGGQRIVLNESSGNTIRLYGDVGFGNEVIAEIGKTSAGAYNAVAKIATFGGSGSLQAALCHGVANSGVWGSAQGNGLGVRGSTDTGAGVLGSSGGSGAGVWGESASGYGVFAQTSGSVAIRCNGGMAVVNDGGISDPYGTLSITMGTGASYSYLGLIRRGQIPYGIGIDTSSRLIFGIPSSGHVSTISSPLVSITSTGGLSAAGGFGCNGKSPQGPYASGGTLAGVIAALVANGILSS